MTIDKEKLKALACEAVGQRMDWLDAGKPWPVWNSRLIDLQEKLTPETVLLLLAEISDLKREADAGQAKVIEINGQFIDELQKLAVQLRDANLQRDQLKAENDTLKAAALGIRDAWREDQAELEALRKDSERYRWLKVERRPAADLDAAFNTYGVPVDEAIDAAMAKEAK